MGGGERDAAGEGRGQMPGLGDRDGENCAGSVILNEPGDRRTPVRRGERSAPPPGQGSFAPLRCAQDDNGCAALRMTTCSMIFRRLPSIIDDPFLGRALGRNPGGAVGDGMPDVGGTVELVVD